MILIINEMLHFLFGSEIGCQVPRLLCYCSSARSWYWEEEDSAASQLIVGLTSRQSMDS